ncbi:MAG: cobalamin-binding protein [Bacillota bacterium]|nr:cobalamin-binding protein [Bacillota bacterium]
MLSRRTPRLLVAVAVMALAILTLTTVFRGCGPAGKPEAAPPEAPKLATPEAPKAAPPGTPKTAPQVPPSNTMTDSFGRNVTIVAKPERIVSLVPSHTEVLFALGLAQQIVGVTKYCDYPAEAKQKTQVGGYSDPSVEKIVALKPDLVLADSMHKTIVEQLESLKIPVLAIEAKTIGAIPDLIEITGKASGRAEQGRALAESLRRETDSVAARTRALDEKGRPRVYYELWHDPLMSVGPGSFLHDLIALAGGTNVMAGAKSAYPVASVEVILKTDPQVIIYCHGQQKKEDIASRPGWGKLTAVKNGKIVLFADENIFMRSGPRIAQALKELAQILHPELFK